MPSTILSLKSGSAIPLWNKFLSAIPFPVPFSFNPSLFDFYIQYFHWKPYYFMLFSGEKLLGVCPLVNTGKRWVSLPHFSYGGFVGTENSQPEWNHQLVQKLIFGIQNERIQPGFFKVDIETIANQQMTTERIFIRSLRKLHPDDHQVKTSSMIQLPKTREALFSKLNSNLRRKIHKGAHCGFGVQMGGVELLDAYYSLYSEKMHRLGSPAYGKGFFKQLLNTYRFGDIKFFLIRKAGKVVGASLLQSYHGFYENTWFATHETAYPYYVSDFLHNQMIQYAISKGASVYSFGRSTPGSGVHKYKSHWPVMDRPIYEYRVGANIQLKNYRWLSAVWKNIPYFVAKQTGPVLVKHIY